MGNLTTRYMGLELDNPIIAGSSGLTSSLDGVRRCADAGAGAIVLKSIFEEQIEHDVEAVAGAGLTRTWHPEADEYITRYGRENSVGEYLRLIADAKRAVGVPVIASVHCVSPGVWTEFARRVEDAGADALELNVFVLPADPRRDGKANERVLFDVAGEVREKVAIPIALKIGPYFSSIAKTAIDLSHSGVQALVLFNRFFRLDFDIEKLEVVHGSLFSRPDEIELPLRWISILAGRLGCDLAASTGVHDGAGVVKLLLAGAAAVQVCSVLYERQPEHLGVMLDEVRSWMKRHDFASVDRFRSRLSVAQSQNPAAFERVQFMKATTGVE
jgi:dihydroorotate dehydrogenase (fumarate)